MKLLLDHNLPFRLVRDWMTCIQVRLIPGVSVWAARLTPRSGATPGENGLVIVSKDSDFRDLALRLGHPPKVIWLRLGNCSTQQVEAALRRHHADLLRFEAEPGTSVLEIF